MNSISFNEKYKIDSSGDLGEETAKSVISHYIDNMINEGTLQDSFNFYCEKIYEQERYIVMQNVKMIIVDNMAEEVKLLYHTDNDYIKNNAKKFNI